MKKGYNPGRVEEDLQNCRDVGIISLCYFIVGFPDETEEELRDTCSLVNRISYTKFVCSYFNSRECRCQVFVYNCLNAFDAIFFHNGYSATSDGYNYVSFQCQLLYNIYIGNFQRLW